VAPWPAGTGAIVVSMSQPPPPDLAAVAAEVKAWNAVAVLGAGVSASARFPMTASLDALLWQALDADPATLAALLAGAGLPELSGKAAIGRLGGDLGHAWKAVAAHPIARERFQRGFAALDVERRTGFSAAHDALAQMLHRRELELVVSLNWDTQLEAAWSARYGQLETIRERLVKPHGDAARPEEPWVLPGEMRPLSTELLARLDALIAERPRVLLVVGYSEADELIAERLIAPLEGRWKVVRVGRSASGPSALRAPAETALPQLRDAIDPMSEERAWSYLRFEPQHDLGWALSGRSLGTRDVGSCPVVPEVTAAVAQLRATGAVTIIGASGAGKSLAAAHAAHALWSEGCEVVQLADPAVEPSQLRQTLLALPRPVVAIVDDAQRLAPFIREDLLASCGDGLSVIVVVTDQVAGEPGVRLDATRAAAVLAEFIRRNRTAVLPAVRSLDPHVGDGPADEPLERRLAQAEGAAKSPWQLSWVLTGGWRRVRGEVVELRESGDHDLALALVAVVQLLRTGDGASRAELLELAGACGRHEPWLGAALDAGCGRRLLVDDRSGVRLPHLRFAPVVLELILSEGAREPLLDAVRVAITGEAYELSGAHWLLDALFFADGRAAPKRSQLSPQIAERLVARCWGAADGDRGAAAFVLNDVRRLQPETVDLESNASLLAEWISQADPVAMPGLARLVNDTYNEDIDLLEPICRHIDVAALARAFEASTWPDPYFFGELFSRLGLGPERFRKALARAFDREAVVALFRAWQRADDARLFDLSEALGGLASFDYELALELCEELAPAMADAWGTRFAAGYSDLLDTLFLLGFGPAFLRRRKPDRHQRRIARKLCEALDPATVASQVSRSTQREWQGVGEGLSLIGEASPRHAKRIMRLLDFERLDASTAQFWPRRVEALASLLVGCARGPDNEPASAWVASHTPQMLRVGALAAALAPAACAIRLRQLGEDMDLTRPGHHWEITALALGGVAATDPDLARRSFARYRPAFTEEFGDASQLEKAELVVEILHDLDPAELRAVIAAIDPAKAQERWTKILRSGPATGRRVVARLVNIALETDGPMRDLAIELRERFPAGTRRER